MTLTEQNNMFVPACQHVCVSMCVYVCERTTFALGCVLALSATRFNVSITPRFSLLIHPS